MKPGMLYQELKKALGMPDGALPPWLTRMQFVGPPTSYPYLKIPGLNAPISRGDTFGDGPDEEEPLDRSKHWVDSDDEEDEEEEEEEELIIHGEIEEGIMSVDTISRARGAGRSAGKGASHCGCLGRRRAGRWTSSFRRV
ncbi:pre-mRNA-splicing factor sap145 [Triticum aestivum]|uniref:pre-mRNA-splicing factor sap145 n=1 Tax=Triticum aestivum TaxID=4565 RepID=UPI001D01B4A7|nr:pre-mRNA-splicing factor sap145-like [Triticum aestivum]